MGLKKLVRKVKRGFVLRMLLWATKGLASGKFGRGPQKVWLFFEGGKTYIGLAFVLLGFGFGEAFNLGVCEQCPAWNQILMTVGVVLAQLGLLDAANREDSRYQEEGTSELAEDDPRSVQRARRRPGTQG